MKPRLFKLAAALLLHLLLVPIVWAAWDEGLLWRLESPGGHVSYVYGTIHLSDPKVLALPERVSQALLGSRRFIMELDANAAAMGELGRMMRLPADQRLSDLIGAGLFEKTVRAFEGHGLARSHVERLQPWAAMMMLSMPPPGDSPFLDLALLDRARRAGLSTGGLETVQEQVDVFRQLTMEDQVLLLQDTVDHMDTITETNRELLELYLAGDLAGMVRLNEQSMAPGDPALMERVFKRLVTDRNGRMLERMQPDLQRGGAFVAIGALHLPGTDGLLQGLEDRGYNVQRAD